MLVGGLALDLLWSPELHQQVQKPWLDWLFVGATEGAIWVYLIGLLIWFIVDFARGEEHQSWAMKGLIVLFLTFVTAFVAKALFETARPYSLWNLPPLVPPDSVAGKSSPSFPSAHAALSMCAVGVLWIRNWRYGIFALIFSLIVGVGRVYELAHFPSDVMAGWAVGGGIGLMILEPNLRAWFRFVWFSSLEFRRQLVHMMAGFAVVFFHWIGILRWRWLIALLLIGFVISLIAQTRKLPIVSQLLTQFDRPDKSEIPGLGALWFVLGVAVTIWFFPTNIAYAALLILALGDSLNHLISYKIIDKKGPLQMPWNPRKNWVGVLIGTLTGGIAACFFGPAFAAFSAAFIALVAETVPLKIGKIWVDDNLIVPLVAGVIMSFLA